MNTFTSSLALIASALSFSCGAQGQDTTNTLSENSVGKKKVLIAYFSHSGNTRAMANQIKDVTHGDLFEIVPLKAYPTAYKAVLDQSKDEIGKNYKPELKTKVADFAQYDVIFVGSPNWYSTIAPPVATFLSSNNFAEKTIVPFMTHGGGGEAHMVADMKKLCPKATFLKALPVNGSSVKSSAPEVKAWVNGLKLAK